MICYRRLVSLNALPKAHVMRKGLAFSSGRVSPITHRVEEYVLSSIEGEVEAESATSSLV